MATNDYIQDTDVPMLRTNIKQTIAKVARISENQFHENSDIRQDLALDSFRAIEVLAAVEKQYNITIKETLLFDISTVGEFLNIVQTQILEKRDVNFYMS